MVFLDNRFSIKPDAQAPAYTSVISLYAEKHCKGVAAIRDDTTTLVICTRLQKYAVAKNILLGSTPNKGRGRYRVSRS